MTVKKLIERLNNIEDKDKPIYIFYNNDLYFIDMIDDSLRDRVDLNVEPELIYERPDR